MFVRVCVCVLHVCVLRCHRVSAPPCALAILGGVTFTPASISKESQHQLAALADPDIVSGSHLKQQETRVLMFCCVGRSCLTRASRGSSDKL